MSLEVVKKSNLSAANRTTTSDLKLSRHARAARRITTRRRSRSRGGPRRRPSWATSGARQDRGRLRRRRRRRRAAARRGARGGVGTRGAASRRAAPFTAALGRHRSAPVRFEGGRVAPAAADVQAVEPVREVVRLGRQHHVAEDAVDHPSDDVRLLRRPRRTEGGGADGGGRCGRGDGGDAGAAVGDDAEAPGGDAGPGSSVEGAPVESEPSAVARSISVRQLESWPSKAYGLSISPRASIAAGRPGRAVQPQLGRRTARQSTAAVREPRASSSSRAHI